MKATQIYAQKFQHLTIKYHKTQNKKELHHLILNSINHPSSSAHHKIASHTRKVSITIREKKDSYPYNQASQQRQTLGKLKAFFLIKTKEEMSRGKC